MKITATKVKTFSTYSLVFYCFNSSWKQLDRPFKDPKDAKRVAKSIKQSQGFNGLTNGGLV